MGRGEKIHIRQDRWIPRPTTFKIQTAPNILTPIATVSELIDVDTLRWNHVLVNQFFSQEETKLILSIPLSGTRQDDVLIWRGTAIRVFSVRSTYHMRKEVEERGQAESSYGGHCSGVWGKLWKLPIPNVEKEFLWRACHEILPTRANLYMRQITKSPKCPICEIEDEMAAHILWNYPSAVDVWSAGERIFQKSSFRNMHFIPIVEKIFDMCDCEEVCQVLGIARRLWLRRNEVLHEGLFPHPVAMIQATKEAIVTYQAAHVFGFSTGATKRMDQWRPPSLGWFTANWNAAINKQQGRWGLGVILRDHTGQMIAAKCSARVG